MSKNMKLVETGEKSKVITFRLGESVYSALEKQAEATGGTVSATARKLLLSSLENEEMIFKPGDTVKYKVKAKLAGNTYESSKKIIAALKAGVNNG